MWGISCDKGGSMTSLEFPMFTIVYVYLSSVLSRFPLVETGLFFS